MISKEELEKQLDAYRDNSFMNKTSFDYYKLIKMNSEKANKYAYSFATIIVSLQFSFIVGTTKFINEKEEGKNYYKLIYLCQNNLKYFDDENRIKDICDSFKKYLDSIQVKVESLKEMRDKVYAHADKKYFINPKEKLKLDISYEDLDAIIHKCYDYVIQIYACFIPLIDNDWIEKLTREFNCITN